MMLCNMIVEHIISESAGLLKYKCHFEIGFNPLWNSSLHQDTIHNFILKHDLCDIYGVITGPVCLCTQAFFLQGVIQGSEVDSTKKF